MMKPGGIPPRRKHTAQADGPGVVVQIGDWVSSGSYNPRSRTPIRVTPPDSALHCGDCISISVTSLNDTESTDREHIFLALYLPRRFLENLRFYQLNICWSDQGWGNRKGRVGIAGNLFHCLTPEVADHSMRREVVDRPFRRERLDQFLSPTADGAGRSGAPPPLEFFYAVGGGGGHTLTIQTMTLNLFSGEFQLLTIFNMFHILRTLGALPTSLRVPGRSGGLKGAAAVVAPTRAQVWLAVARQQLEVKEVYERLQLPRWCPDPERGTLTENAEVDYEALATWYLSLATLPYDVQRRTLEYLYIPLENLLPGNPASWALPLIEYVKYL